AKSPIGLLTCCKCSGKCSYWKYWIIGLGIFFSQKKHPKVLWLKIKFYLMSAIAFNLSKVKP
ncbi:hypothetical protein, partial [Acinetobacter baumannii]|uniref:hypothetical protein n=1 Tax=Acinetobacter baumannii TaxID=470 RepID=UPI001BB25FAF